MKNWNFHLKNLTSQHSGSRAKKISSWRSAWCKQQVPGGLQGGILSLKENNFSKGAPIILALGTQEVRMGGTRVQQRGGYTASSRPAFGSEDLVLTPVLAHQTKSKSNLRERGGRKIKMRANTTQKANTLKMLKISKDRCPWKGWKRQVESLKKKRREKIYITNVYT